MKQYTVTNVDTHELIDVLSKGIFKKKFYVLTKEGLKEIKQ